MQYPQFQDAGWPIGDGAVESANKLVVEARLKGSGMHWAPDHVNPMVALRNIACNDRWDEAWPQIVGILRQQEQNGVQSAVTSATGWSLDLRSSRRRPLSLSQRLRTHPGDPAAATKEQARQQATPGEPRRPAANHPWRRMPVGRARYAPTTKQADAKS